MNRFHIEKVLFEDKYFAAYHAYPSSPYKRDLKSGDEIAFMIERQLDGKWMVRHDQIMDRRIFDSSWANTADSVESACALIETTTRFYLKEHPRRGSKEIQGLREKYPPKNIWNKMLFRLGLAKISWRILAHGEPEN